MIENDSWPKTASEAVTVQQALRKKVTLFDGFKKLKTIAGVDVSYDIKSNLTHAFIVLFEFPSLKVITSTKAILPTTFPYIPGFLSFREAPAILEALKQLPQKPDLLMVDGQGIAHPRRFGIACHLGVLTDLPSLGVAKSRLTGTFKEPALTKGSKSLLVDKNEVIGTVLRSKDNVKPLFISPGNKISHETALDLVIKCLKKHRLPEPTRIADKLSKDKTSQPSLI